MLPELRASVRALPSWQLPFRVLSVKPSSGSFPGRDAAVDMLSLDRLFRSILSSHQMRSVALTGWGTDLVTLAEQK